ncbi:hypothetical protein P152DRAFT_387040 [Eremomyces bilateralis CBS 781.70]|uniref:Uncharacterized protein n=1 Tax=Eremomyces bilateralis CBS 781.70 TaxID=1392243 RepID=A0A6G1GIC4_9PEZI|nr:uncharacterized protein P152DRAFT_387040 [Eremomyces bilateralis CBS 781.70]KAF1817651.1 hypothetical protein P152DRAFT_387040 [Eremomyces bilateralis CBS 781.70]
MGWFSSDPKAKDAAYVPPDREARNRCWEARDTFYDCLDKHSIVNPLEDDRTKNACPKELAGFEKNCASSWVKYFQQKRYADFRKEESLRKLKEQGAEFVGELSGGPGK